MKKGMTLIEVLVSALIMSMALTSLLVTFVECQKIIIQNLNRFNAALVVNEHFEVLQNHEIPDSVVAYVNRYSTKKEIPNMANSFISSTKYWMVLRTAKIVNPTAATDLRQVTAEVTWNEGGPKNTLLMSMISNEPN